jgi:hypothetical protein
MYGAGMSPILEFARITDARSRLKEIYDSAERRVPSVVQREHDAPVAVVLKADLVQALRALCPVEPQVRFAESGRVSAWIDGLPVSAEGASLGAVEQGLVDALRDYAGTWVDDLGRYPNHEQNWGIVNLVLLSDDAALIEHLFGDEP